MRMRTTAAALTLGLFGLTACGPTMSDLPLPGKGVSGQTVHVTMEFNDALNLAQGAPIKVNGVDEGKVEGITVDNYRAKVDMTVKTAAQLRQGLKARLRYTTPLGELYVDITNPSSGPTVTNNENFGTSITTTAPTVEDALSQASLLITGGGIGSMQTITTELTNAFGGKAPVWRDLLNRINSVVTKANATTGDIDTALNALNNVSLTIAKREATIHRALKEIAPAAQVLKSETPNLTNLLNAVQTFATQANSTLRLTQHDLLVTLGETQPVLATLVANRGQWVGSLNSLVTLGQIIQNVIPGDYLNIGGELAVNQGLLGNGLLGNVGGLVNGLTGGKNGGLLGGVTGLLGGKSSNPVGGLVNGVGGLVGGLTGSKSPAPAPKPSSSPKCLLPGILC